MLMVIIVAVMVIIVMSLTKYMMYHGKCCIVTGASATSWFDDPVKVSASGLMILRKLVLASL
jgi:hypothetical protein